MLFLQYSFTDSAAASASTWRASQMPLASIVRSLELVNNAATGFILQVATAIFYWSKRDNTLSNNFLESPTLDCDCTVFFVPNVNQSDIANGSKMFCKRCKQWLLWQWDDEDDVVGSGGVLELLDEVGSWNQSALLAPLRTADTTRFFFLYFAQRRHRYVVVHSGGGLPSEALFFLLVFSLFSLSLEAIGNLLLHCRPTLLAEPLHPGCWKKILLSHWIRFTIDEAGGRRLLLPLLPQWGPCQPLIIFFVHQLCSFQDLFY